MATVTTILTLNDQMSGKLNKIDRNLESVDDSIDRVKTSSITFGVVAGNAITSLISKTAELVSSIPEIGDAYALTQARLGLITQEGETVAEINEKIYQSAQASKGAYLDTASAVSKLGLLAGEAFSSTDEIIRFAELMNKSFKVGGASIEEQTAGMYQLTQAMAAGKLQGDEFRSIMENAPMLAQAIADFTGKSKGELKEMSSEGKITAEIIKGALFDASDDINSKFEEIPDTWGSTMQRLKNQAYMAFGDISSKISSSLANGISSFVSSIARDAEYIIIIIGAIGTAISVLIVSKIATMINTLLIAASVWGLMNMPILIVAALVGSLLFLFLEFPEVFGTIVGAAAAAGEMIINAFKAVYNVIATVLNVLIKAINLIPGVNVPEIKMLEYKQLSDVYKTGKDWVVGGSNAFSEKISNIGGIFANKGASNYSTTGLEANQLAGIGSGIDGLNDKLSGSGSLKSVGETEIKTDNLKWLLDIASTKYQKEYQKAPVYVNVSTGDINSGTDEARLLRKLEDSIINAYNENLVVV